MLTPSQTAAMEEFEKFVDSDTLGYCLLGTAGTGKSYLTAKMLDYIGERGVIFAAPTHKAIGVSRRFLRENDIAFQVKFDEYRYDPTMVLTGTTSSLLGIAPIIADNQDEKRRKFAKVGQGILNKMSKAAFRVRFVFVDEDVCVDAPIARADFEAWIAPELAEMDAAVERLLATTGVAADDVDRVFLTGGTSFVPAVKRLFAARFGAHKLLNYLRYQTRDAAQQSYRLDFAGSWLIALAAIWADERVRPVEPDSASLWNQRGEAIRIPRSTCAGGAGPTHPGRLKCPSIGCGSPRESAAA